MTKNVSNGEARPQIFQNFLGHPIIVNIFTYDNSHLKRV